MWCSASITSVDKITNQTWKFVIQPNEKFDFIPGQFTQLKVRDTIRSYSIASYEPKNNFFELLIVKLDGGVMTKLLFEDINIGEKIEIKGPIGRFTLPDNIDRDIFLICTGTGLAPFRSFLHFINKKNIRKLLAEVSSKIYNKKPKNLIAVTGTNGKSSVSDFYYQILRLNKKRVASIDIKLAKLHQQLGKKVPT